MKADETTPSMERYYASLERFFFEHPTQPERLIAEHPGWEAQPERLAIYGRFVTGHVRKTVGKVFSACKALTPEAVWAGWISAYTRRRPAKHYRLNQAAADFVAFLAEQPEAPPYLLELARFEWTKLQVYCAQTEVPEAVERLTVNPTLATLEHAHRVCSYCERRERDPRPPEQGDEIALVWRHPKTRLVRFRAADASALLVLKLALEGIEIERAATEGGVPRSAVEAAIADQERRGLVLAPYPVDFE